jgi:alkylhydroperoxidase/carboxymuconolactone decarboxylase family protein YurZ
MHSDPIDDELEQSFPASDPPHWSGMHAGAPSSGGREAKKGAGDPKSGMPKPREGEWDLSKGAVALRERALTPGPLEAKTVELIAFALHVALAREGAHAHAVAARNSGASLDELHQALALAVVAGGLGVLDSGLEILNDLG